MGIITISVSTDSNASIFEVCGEVTAEEIIAAMEKQYIAGAPPHAVWDYSRASFHRLNSGDYQRIANAAKASAQNRPGGKTGFVAPGETEAIAIKLLQAISKTIDLPISIGVYQSREEALSWISQT